MRPGSRPGEGLWKRPYAGDPSIVRHPIRFGATMATGVVTDVFRPLE